MTLHAREQHSHAPSGMAESRRPPTWSALQMILIVVMIILLAILLGLWTGLSDPRRLEVLMGEWSAPWAGVLAACAIVALVVIPSVWILITSSIDLIAFFLAWEALIMAGYFFLGISAWKLGPEFGGGILRAAPLVVLINVTGFCVLFLVLGMSYFAGVVRQLRLQPLRDKPEEYDLRLKWFLRVAGIVTVCILSLPMAVTGVIPLFAENTVVDPRIMVTESSPLRAFYNLGYGLMPFVTAGMLILCLRKPWRFLGLDGLIACGLMIAQLLSGNRFPLALAVIATLSLMTMERRFPRLLTIGLFAAFMFSFIGLGGLTGLLRWDREELASGNPVAKSMESAFTGNNLIDVRDAAWVLSKWDFDPLMGRTYLGGLTAMVPSGLFPQKKEWHLGLYAIQIVGWKETMHPGLRVTFFGESFLNFGLAGVLTLGAVLGILFGSLLRIFHQTVIKRPPCLHYNMKLLILMEMSLHLSNTSNAFSFWALGGLLALQWLAVDFPVSNLARTFTFPSHAPSRT